VQAFLHDLETTTPGERVLVIGHSAIRYALEHLIAGRPLDDVIARPGKWQPGWTYRLDGRIDSRRGASREG
jgi:hypothetical protein